MQVILDMQHQKNVQVIYIIIMIQTAQQQTLNNILTQLNKQDTSENKTLIIYNCFTPLSKEEDENDNITKIHNIPDGIKNAINEVKSK